ncbi:MAG TPA: bifunctional [glutamine synthetase] adenylyltransferase/[glutamine synthetase]-adenylyl-L-tyrosine phosphorylase [Alphaproteobacteria bacterium]|nr:bifunctional [glutamine synthetase] adenylyltransferase/[glutamine synthetase]-adenylyl-L-tyrosine phosphorylase [Alphaproteobacteria bacterium]
MESSTFLTDSPALPRAADPVRAAIGLERWTEEAAASGDRALETAAAALVGDATMRRMLDALFGNSPFLTHCALIDVAFTCSLLNGSVEESYSQVLSDLGQVDPTAAATDQVMATMRTAKRRAALAIAVADIAMTWPLERVTASLSEVAALSLQLAVRHQLAQAAARGWLRLVDGKRPEEGSGYFILGLGKLGAFELNYSSDIDLVALYDDEIVQCDDRDTINKNFVKLTRNIVRMMQERTPDGYVFRTDLRLRPDPAATPVALSTTAAEFYYESLGQNWERAAFIKARPVAGDLAAGERFLRGLRPFLWRKHLDFAAIRDIHSIKRQINAHRGGDEIIVLGQNLKLGRGGIREIEFFAQTQQLIWGGREPALRARGTCDALRALVAGGHVKQEIGDQLIESYGFLRRVEHRLQMVDDQQTQELPESTDGLEHLAIFLGFENSAAFSAELLRHLRRVEAYYARLFEEAPNLGVASGNLVFTGADHDPDTLKTIEGLGFVEPATASAIIRGWHHGRYRAMRSTRARELLTELTPALLDAVAKAANPDAALLSFDRFLSRLPQGVQLFSLFHANPSLLGLVAEIMGSAPRIADQLAQHPLLLDSVLTGDFFRPLPDRSLLATSLAEALRQANDFEDVLDITRRWTNDRKFQVGVQMLRGTLDPEAAGPVLADIAQCVIGALIEPVTAELAETHGRLPVGDLAVIALGKLGGREMTMTSDLDLLFIYDVPAGIEATDGRRPLAPSHYFVRLSQRLLSAITSPTAEGRLYDVDMRLRPSGEKGPLATSLQGFLDYQMRDAWTWEHMALTRARVVAGPVAFAARIEAALADVLTAPRKPEKLLHDVAEMRALIEKTHATSNIWEGKRVRGGLVDLEFIAQYLQLRYGNSYPQVLSPNTTEAFDRLRAASVLENEMADDLIAATRLWRRVQGILRLAEQRTFEEDQATDGLRQVISRAAGAVDFSTLKAALCATAERVREHFAFLIEEPARKLAPANMVGSTASTSNQAKEALP